MGLMNAVGIREAAFIPYLNTGNPIDLATGVFIPGMEGNAILNGGLAYTNGFVGREQMYKSTTALSLSMASLTIYPNSEGVFYDTESSLTRPRVLKFGKSALLPEVNNLEERVTICDRSEYHAESFHQKLEDICAEKEKHRNDYIVESPFIDPKTGKALRIWIPTIVGYDSWSKMGSDAVQKMYDKTDIGSSDTNMVFMKDGLIKSKIMSQLPGLAAKYGIYFIMTAHIGDKIEMNPYAASPKDLQYMKGTDKIKHVGADFTFLTSNLIETRAAKLLQDPDKECLYPDKFSTPVELSQVTDVICRCKNNSSGQQLSEIISQPLGIQTSLTNYHYLKEAEYFGLVGNKVSHKPCLCPDVTLERKTVRNKLEEYRTARAIELIMQLHYIQNNWMLRDIPIDFMIKVEKFAEALLTNKTYAIDDILNSRGYWTYDKTNPRSYLSIWDCVAIIEGKYKPKFIGLKK